MDPTQIMSFGSSSLIHTGMQLPQKRLDRRKARFYDSNPGEFFIFFPRDWHIAKVATDGEDQTIRVIVIKVDYKD